MMLEVGDKVNVLDCSWSYVITDHLAEHQLRYGCGLEGWTVVAINVRLPTPTDSRHENDTIIKKGDKVAFICSLFLKRTICPRCGQLIM